MEWGAFRLSVTLLQSVDCLMTTSCLVNSSANFSTVGANTITARASLRLETHCGTKATLLLTGTSREHWMIYRGPGFLARRMIWLLPYRFPPPVSKIDRRHKGRLRKRYNLMGVVEETIIQMRESLVLYKSFNTLWVHASLVRGFDRTCRIQSGSNS